MERSRRSGPLSEGLTGELDYIITPSVTKLPNVDAVDVMARERVCRKDCVFSVLFQNRRQLFVGL